MKYDFYSITAVALALLFISSPGTARQSGGTSVADALLRGGVGARPSALGNAYTAMAEGPSAVRYNPAALAREQQSGLMFQYDNALLDIGRSDILFSTPLWGGGLGLGFSMIDYGMFVRTTTTNKSGSGSVSAKDYLVRAAYAWSIGRSLDFGGSLGVYRIELDDVGAAGVTGDIAVRYQTPIDAVRLGAAIQHVGSRAQFYSRNEALPTALSIGAVYQPNTWATLTADYELVRASGGAVKAGAEILLLDNLMVRGGFDGRNDAGSGLTSGLGFVKNNFSLDYAYIPLGDLGNSHRYSISWTFGPMVEREKRQRPADDARGVEEAAVAVAIAGSSTDPKNAPMTQPSKSSGNEARPSLGKNEGMPESDRKVRGKGRETAMVGEPATQPSVTSSAPMADWTKDTAPKAAGAAKMTKPDYPMEIEETWPAAAPRPDRVAGPKREETPGAREAREASNRLMSLAREFLDKGEYGRAIIYYRSAVTMDQSNFDALYNLATVYYLTKDYDGAFKTYEKAIAVNGNDVDANQFAGSSAYRLGNTDAARKYWRRALELNPADQALQDRFDVL